MLAAEALPPPSSPKRAHSTYIHPDHILTLVSRGQPSLATFFVVVKYVIQFRKLLRSC